MEVGAAKKMISVSPEAQWRLASIGLVGKWESRWGTIKFLEERADLFHFIAQPSFQPSFQPLFQPSLQPFLQNV